MSLFIINSERNIKIAEKAHLFIYRRSPSLSLPSAYLSYHLLVPNPCFPKRILSHNIIKCSNHPISHDHLTASAYAYALLMLFGMRNVDRLCIIFGSSACWSLSCQTFFQLSLFYSSCIFSRAEFRISAACFPHLILVVY